MAILRKTKSLKKLLHKFEADVNAHSVVDLVDLLNDDMNKTTVYRILDRLENEGELHSFTGKDGLKWYAKCQNCTSDHHEDLHPHFQCKICGKSECLDTQLQLPDIKTHQIDRAELLLVGECEECLSSS